ncbi:hypothetical protein F5Y15DRAFT_314358 [Xylariaceae sp. FL0016]|nr:hypothetical protein F5Y15DRAFT_314358 [Xylariaceae sp. FL0016]
MRFSISSLAFAAAVTALPSSHIKRQDFVASASRLIPVVVGGTQDTYVPNSVTAAVGDIIQFQFSSGNHTVTQSSGVDAPCTALQGTVATAIHSGHIPFEDGATTVGTFNMPVTTTDTLFLFCATGPHCQEGQVMIVNPTDDQQILDFANAASLTAASVDGTTVVGGTVASIPIDAAAFDSPAAQAEDPAAAPPAEAAPAATSVPGTTTVLVTVTPTVAAVGTAVPAA